jgi:hypothetical protein
LRRTTGSTAALLVHASGDLRAIDSLDSDLNAGVLGMSLIDAQRGVSLALAQAFQAQDPIRQSYFGTASFGVCVYRLDDAHVVATIFGPEVREGQVWYAMREGIEALQQALRAGKEAPPEQRSPGKSEGFAMVERYFAERDSAQSTHRHNPREQNPSTHAQGAAASSQESAAGTPARQALPSDENDGNRAQSLHNLDLVPAPASAPLEMERLKIDEIDWEAEGSQDWDALAADTNQSFLGMSFQEAKKRGLLNELDAEQ